MIAIGIPGASLTKSRVPRGRAGLLRHSLVAVLSIVMAGCGSASSPTERLTPVSRFVCLANSEPVRFQIVYAEHFSSGSLQAGDMRSAVDFGVGSRFGDTDVVRRKQLSGSDSEPNSVHAEYLGAGGMRLKIILNGRPADSGIVVLFSLAGQDLAQDPAVLSVASKLRWCELNSGAPVR